MSENDETNRASVGLPLSSEALRKAKRDAVLATCFGSLGFLSFQNGLMLLFFTALKIESANIIVLLSLYNFGMAALLAPAAYVADLVGKQRVGFAGQLLCTLAFAGIVVCGFFPAWATVILGPPILLYAAGTAAYNGGWFALLHPLIPAESRGRFFGVLRTAWQSAGMLFVGLTAFFLAHDTPVFVYQLILSVIALCLLVRIFFYLRIPEIEGTASAKDGFFRSLKILVRVPGYAPFCAYVFLLMLFTAGCPTLFGLLEKQILNFGDRTVMWLGVILMAGNVLGYYLGGLAVDRFGTRTAFVFCHFTFGLVLLSVPLRDFSPFGVLPVMAALNFLFGLVAAASSIAVTTEMMSLLPPAHKSLAAAVCLTLLRLGGALSGFMGAWVLKLGVLRESWTLWGATLSPYDALLLGSGVMIVLLVVTLGLVPSVIGKAEWLPGHH